MGKEKPDYGLISKELQKLAKKIKTDKQVSDRVWSWALDKFKNGACATMQESFAESFASYYAVLSRESEEAKNGKS